MEHYVTLRATEKFLLEYGVLPGECQVKVLQISIFTNISYFCR